MLGYIYDSKVAIFMQGFNYPTTIYAINKEKVG
jgi:hypothetical protein